VINIHQITMAFLSLLPQYNRVLNLAES